MNLAIGDGHSPNFLTYMIRKSGAKGYIVMSEKGKPLSKPGMSKKQAEKRLKQVEYFKHQKEKT